MQRNFQKTFPWLISEKVYLPLCRFSNRMMTPRLKNGRSKTSVVNILLPFNKPLIAHFQQFSKRLSDFKHSYLSPMATKIKNNIPKLKLDHWQSKNISFLKILLLLCIFCLIKQRYFAYSTETYHLQDLTKQNMNT